MNSPYFTDPEEIQTDIVAYFDGACRGNPGTGARGATLLEDDTEIATASQQLRGKLTNNQAEYRALEAALQLADRHGVSELLVRGDSELIIKQVKGEYSVNANNLKPFHDRVTDLLQSFDAVALQHVPRSKNKRADELASQAIRS
jgi:ribonuclease HI